MKALFLSIPLTQNVQIIKTIVDETDADIIIACKWRNSPDIRKFTVEDLEKDGFNRDRIFFTPYNKPRGGIEEFLQEHDSIETFVILNYDVPMFPDGIIELREKYSKNYIDVNFDLWPVEAMKAISILNGVK